MATDPNQVLYDQIAQYLSAADLGGLFSTPGGQPGGWLWDQITNGLDNEAALQIALEATPQFQARYGVISQLRAQASTGAPVHIPSVAQVREYEQRTAALMRQAGLPPHMYDNWQDTHALMLNGLSVVEVEQRLGQAFERVQNTDLAVRQAYSDFYGTLMGDAALASTFLDPTRTMAALEKQSRAAYTSGMGRSLGIELDQQVSERIAGMPMTEAGIMENLTQLNGLDKSGVMTETIGESAENLTTQGVGVDAVVFGDGNASGEIERRIIERQAARAAVPGGALRTQSGLAGTGTASR